MRKKVIALILVVVMLVAAVPAALAANEYDDIQGHWGQAAIDRWIQAGVAEGREDGSFAPNEAMTREEAARMFVNLLHLTREANVNQYTDLDPNSPYYSDIAKCVAAGIFTGTSDHTMSPSADLTREQLFTTFARALGIQPVSTSSVTFVDGAKVSDWAEGYINALANMGAVRGVSDGSLLPQDDINRASVMAVLDQAISVYADTNGATVGESDGIVLVVADQVSVMGDVQNLVVAGGSASVSGGTVANASLVGEAAELNVSGNAVVAEIAVNSEGSQLNVSGRAQVGSVTVAGEATGTVVNVNDTAAVNTVTSQADGVTIAGSGTVNSAVVSGDNTAVNTNGTNLTVSQGTTGVTENGSAVSGGTTVETAPGTSGTPSNPPVYVPTYYTVTFHYTDGTAESTSYVVAGSAVQFPGVTAPEGQKISWYDENGQWVSNTSNVIVNSNRTFTAVAGSDAFTAGNGTQMYPYLIANGTDFSAIASLGTANPYYFKQIADIAISDIQMNLNGVYDGGGHSIKLADGLSYDIGYFCIFGDTFGDTTIKNLTLMSRQGGVPTLLSYHAGESLTVSNIVVDSASDATMSVNTNNFGFIVANPLYEGWGINSPQTFRFENITITNNVSIMNAGTCIGAIVGSGPCFNFAESSVTYINCVNNGTIIGTTYAGMLYGNPSYIGCIEQASQFVAEGCANNGTIKATLKNGVAAMCPKADTNPIMTEQGYAQNLGTGSYSVASAISDNTFCAYSSADNNFVLVSPDASSEYSYQLVFSVYTIKWNDGAVSNGIKVTVPATVAASAGDNGNLQITSSVCHAYDLNTAIANGIISEEEAANLTTNASGAYSPYVKVTDSQVYVIFLNVPNGTVDSSLLLYAYAYEGNDLVGVKQF